jgi:hypothetical protein
MASVVNPPGDIPPPELSPPSPACAGTVDLDGPPNFHRCYPDLSRTTGIDWFRNPAPTEPQPPGGNNFTDSGAYPGYGPGMPLLSYLLDWGDCTARVRRRLANISILKAWPRPQERQLAHRLLSRFTWLADNHDDELTLYLIGTPAFIGYNWHAGMLKDWLDDANAAAAAAGAPRSLTPPLALEAARKWCDAAARLWIGQTTDVFPYDPPMMANYWIASQRAAPLP